MNALPITGELFATNQVCRREQATNDGYPIRLLYYPPDSRHNAFYELNHVIPTTSIRLSAFRGDSGVLMGRLA